jgi:hypothetical protein
LRSGLARGTLTPNDMPSQLIRSVLLSALTLLIAPATRAIDVTGTWTGEQRCKFFDGVQTKRTFGLSNQVKISQLDGHVAVETPGGVGSFYNGQVQDDANKPTKGRVVLAECRSAANLDGYNELVHLTGTANQSSGRLRGDSVVRSQLGEIGTCKWKLIRSSGANPQVTGCPCCE